MFLHVKNCQD